MRIDLTKIGHDENIIHDVLNKDQWLKEKFPEAHIVGNPHEIKYEIPAWVYPQKESIWRQFINNINILP